jgi:hypothetical protein
LVFETSAFQKGDGGRPTCHMLSRDRASFGLWQISGLSTG